MTGLEPALLVSGGAAGGAAASGAAASGAAAAMAAGAAPMVTYGGAAAASGAAAGAAGGLFSTSNLLLASTALSGVSALVQGQQQAAALEGQAQQAEQMAQMERLDASLREEQRLKNLNQTMATTRVLFGARGLDVSSGSARKAMEAAASQAAQETNIDRAKTGATISSAGSAAAGYRRQAGGARIGGIGGAGASLLDFALTRRML